MSMEINVYDYMNVILQALKTGVLVTTCNGGKVNSMSISWGQIGIEWNRLIFTTYIRTGRFTYEQLNKNPEFTVNIPLEGMNVTEYIKICGTISGREVDKIEEAGMDTVASQRVGVPGIRQLPLTLECKVIYRQLQDMGGIPDDIRSTFYPGDVPSEF